MLPARLFLLLALAAASGAHAEKADRARPVNLEADRVTLDDANQTSVYEGDVALAQGTLSLRAARVSVRQKDGGLESVEAVGNPVAFRQKTDAGDWIEGYAARIDYHDASGILELSGQARLKRGGDELRGERIRYNAATSTYQVSGGADRTAPDSRVRAVIRPKAAAPQP